ncbi:MAG: hydantoinase/oxoprolinase family protein [Rhodospirillales bacterium]|nr:hydantoinase/oxoprolinase family protein [Rhodospirillales bacterium]
MSTTIGIDVGGTFTDVVVTGPDGTTTIAKAATTPADQSDGVLAGIALAAQALGFSTAALLAAADRIVHGTTAATNALLEGKAARVAMLTTAGHRDVIEMREGLKPERYNLRLPPPDPLVPRALRLPVRERLRPDGTVAIPLDPASLDAALATLEAEQVAAVAVCFLHSWRNPAHERAVAAAVRARLPGAYVCASAEVLGQIKEYERFSTAVANAAVGPVISAYLHRLEARLAEAGYGGTLFVILSHGGVATVAEAVRLAAGTALSGPAGGVAAAVALSEAGLGHDLIAFDMGGTSTDIALVRDGAPGLAEGRAVGQARIALPSLDIVTLGAGGGSIADRDRSGLLAVGPASAGAEPGPACYGLGGLAATVTDANLVLGYLDPERFLGGRRTLDRGAAAAAIGRLAVALGLSTEAAAAGVQRMVDTRMADGVRIATVRRGVDPRRFALLAFGGAAGLHVTAVAAALGISRVVVPRAAAVLSAWGMLNTDLRIELAQSLEQTAGIDPAALRAAFAAMEAEGRSRLGPAGAGAVIRRSADMRYGEQVFEIPVSLDAIDWDAPGLAARLAGLFHERHRTLYTYAMPDEEVVVVNARVSVIGRLPAPPAKPVPPRLAAEAAGWRRIYLDGWREAPVFDFAALAPGQDLAGPALVESDTTTVLLRPGDRARLAPLGWLDIAVGPG